MTAYSLIPTAEINAALDADDTVIQYEAEPVASAVTDAAAQGEPADAWWAWHDQDASRASATMEEAEERCAAWVAGTSDDGPDREDVVEVEVAMDTPNAPRDEARAAVEVNDIDGDRLTVKD